MTLSDLLCLLLSSSLISKSGLGSIDKINQSEFLTVPPCIGGRKFPDAKHAFQCCKRQLTFLSFENNACKAYVESEEIAHTL